MTFDWDSGNIDHIARHGLTPSDAEQVLQNDPLKVKVEIRNGEKRTLYLGATGARLVLFVAVTDRNGLTRVVTAYQANKKMRAFYLAQKGVSP